MRVQAEGIQNAADIHPLPHTNLPEHASEHGSLGILFPTELRILAMVVLCMRMHVCTCMYVCGWVWVL
jgi:hypothetical protein